MEKVINVVMLVVGLVIVFHFMTKSLPAGGHRLDEKGNYVPIKTSLWKELIK